MTTAKEVNFEGSILIILSFYEPIEEIDINFLVIHNILFINFD